MFLQTTLLNIHKEICYFFTIKTKVCQVIFTFDKEETGLTPLNTSDIVSLDLIGKDNNVIIASKSHQIE